MSHDRLIVAVWNSDCTGMLVMICCSIKISRVLAIL